MMMMKKKTKKKKEKKKKQKGGTGMWHVQGVRRSAYRVLVEET
jgi:hypothetical protein